MKSIALALIALFAVTAYAQDERPKLSLVQASQISQQKLESLQLGPEYFLRSIQLVWTAENPELRYESQFEPTRVRKVQAVTETGTDKYRVIVVHMDGKSQVAERERRVKRVRATKASE